MCEVECLKEMKSTLIEGLNSQLQGDLATVDTDEAGKVADIIKDMAQTIKYCREVCYYEAVVEAMESGGENHSLSTALDNYCLAKKHYSETNSIRYKADMTRCANECVSDVIASIKSIWEEADPELRLKLKSDLDKLMLEMS